MERKLLRELSSTLKFMSSKEKKIAEYILLNATTFTGLSLKQFSELSNVSQGSIVNFSKKYTGGGFPVLKMEVASCVAVEEKKQKIASVAGEYKSITYDVFERIKASLDNTYAVNDEESILSVVKKILLAKKVEVCGVYRSAVVANDFYLQLVQLGIPANFVSDVLTCAISASFLDSESLFIAISFSGRTKDVIDAVKIAKEKNVPVVCITGNKNSPLAKLSDQVLVAATSGSEDGTATETRLSQIALTDAICKILAQKLKGDVAVNAEVINKILTSHNVND